jgi:hypothetical protein
MQSAMHLHDFSYYYGNQNPPDFLDINGDGIYNYTFTLKGTAFNTVPNANIPQIPLPEINESGTETMIVFGLGYLFKLGKHWYFDFKGNYNVLTNAFAVNEPVNPADPNAVYGVKGTLQYVSILAGINYRF